MQKPLLTDNFFQNNRIDTTNAFLDSSWPKQGRKIAPKSNELTNSEKSSFVQANCQDFWQPCLIWIFPAAVLLLDLERIYESFRENSKFHENLNFFVLKKPVLRYRFS